MKGGAMIIDYIVGKGKDATPKKAFEMLDNAGFNDVEKNEVVTTVLAFMRHTNGKHDLCPKGMCCEQKHKMPTHKPKFTAKELNDWK